MNRACSLRRVSTGLGGGGDAEALELSRLVKYGSAARHTGKKSRDIGKRRLPRRDDEAAFLVGAVASLEGIVEWRLPMRSDLQHPEIFLSDAGKIGVRSEESRVKKE